jgi:hypothetical protein
VPHLGIWTAARRKPATTQPARARPLIRTHWGTHIQIRRNQVRAEGEGGCKRKLYVAEWVPPRSAQVAEPVIRPRSNSKHKPTSHCSRSFLTSFDPMRPLPPITTIFIIAPSVERRFLMCRSYPLRPNSPPFCDAMLRPLFVSARQTERRV